VTTRRRLILAGGGGTEDSRPLDERFAEWIGPSGRMLYWPIAMDGQRPCTYAQCLDWVSSVYHPLGVTDIEMWTNLADRDPGELDRFDAVYIGGGNTFRLLYLVRQSGFDHALARFVAQGGAIHGGSAGAILLGRDIMTCAHLDTNEVGIVDTAGLDLASGYAIWCHYQPEDGERIAAYIEQYGFPVLALSEHSGVQIEDERMSAISFEPLVLFTFHGRRVIDVGEQIS
jgi:dipeptidase E